MILLRLRREWESTIRAQYEIESQTVDLEQCIKLLIRCKKMYEAKALVLKLLKMTIDKDKQVKQLRRDQEMLESEKKEIKATIRRLGGRITSQVNTLQEEHRIMRRPFLIGGRDYIKQIARELEDMDYDFNNSYFVDESGTTGQQKF